jgi:hypothetical protein
VTYTFEKRKTRFFLLRIKPLVMKRKWKGMSIRRKKNFDEVEHVDTSLYFLLIDEGEVFQPSSPPTHEVEGVSLIEEEFKDLVEAIHTFFILTHKDKEIVIFSDTNSPMK